MNLIEGNRDFFAEIMNLIIRYKNGYSDSLKHRALRYYLEGIAFRRVDKLCHVSIINWVKKASKQIKEKSTKHPEKIYILELY